MTQQGITKQQACNELYEQIEDAWKILNQQLLKTSSSAAAKFVPSKPILFRVINLARVIDVFYKHKDEYTHVGETMCGYINSLFIEPIPLQ